MANSNNRLKAYVRYDGTGRVIAGSLILQRSKPKVGNWQEIPAHECCNYVPTTTTTTTSGGIYTIGQAALGGIIAYINGGGTSGTSGLVATVADFPSGYIQWGCRGTEIVTGTAIGTGNQNTIDIMAGCPTAGIAARLCGDLVEGGYNDWYLPSQDELNALYINRVAIGGFVDDSYWSSSQPQDIFGQDAAFVQDFTDGSQGQGGKITGRLVRAVRSF